MAEQEEATGAQSAAVNTEVETGATTTDSAPVGNDTSTPSDDAFDDNTFDDIDDEVAESGEADDDDSDDNAENAQETQSENTNEDVEKLAPKSQNRFQKLANENRELREQLDRLKSQENQVATEQELLNEINPETGDYYTPQEAERVARQHALGQMQQQAAQQRYALEVRQSQENIGNESLQALQDFPMLDPQNKDYNDKIATQFDDLLAENLIFELPDGSRYPASVLAANGINFNQATLLGSNISPYKLAKLIADSSQANAAVYQANAQRSTERMLANADTLGGNSQTGHTDTDLDDFDKAWDD